LSIRTFPHVAAVQAEPSTARGALSVLTPVEFWIFKHEMRESDELAVG